MLLISEKPCEFRIKREYTSKNSGKTSYFYTFEEASSGSFELWSNDNMALEKGKNYKLIFDLSFFGGDKKFTLKNVIIDNGK